MVFHNVSSFLGSGTKGKSGCKPIVRRQAEITEINKLQAAKPETAVTNDTDLLGDKKKITLKRMVADTPPKKAETNNNCSAIAKT